MVCSLLGVGGAEEAETEVETEGEAETETVVDEESEKRRLEVDLLLLDGQRRRAKEICLVEWVLIVMVIATAIDITIALTLLIAE